MAERLNPAGGTVQVGPVLITAPGLTGQAEYLPPGLPGTRAAEQTSPGFLQALDAAGYLEQFSVVVADPRETDGNGGTRAAGGGDEVTLRVPGPGAGFAQVMLYTAEDGTLSWHLPDELASDGAGQDGAGQDGAPVAPTTRAGDVRTYRVPRVVSPVPARDPSAGAPAQRGVVGMLAKKVFKVLAFPLVERTGEFVAERIALNWEAEHRPHRLRTFSTGDQTGPGTDLTPAHWDELTKGRALLFVHGTFSSIRGGFGGLPAATLDALHANYGGRVFGFDHPTLASSPRDNVAWLAGQFTANIPAGRTLDVDLISHSRGGLVVRELCEFGSGPGGAGGLGGLGDRFRAGTAVLVASPNAGTALADVKYWKTWLDRVTNVLQLLPDNPVTDTLDAVLTVLKHLAVGAVRGLDGLNAMDPKGAYLTGRLNKQHGWPPASGERTRYYAVASNYEPAAGSPLARVTKDGVVDLVFGEAGNDLVVPTDGVATVPGAGGFPIEQKLVLDPGASIEHSHYWTNPQCTAQLSAWLTG